MSARADEGCFASRFRRGSGQSGLSIESNLSNGFQSRPRQRTPRENCAAHVIRVDSQVGIALKSPRHRTAHSTQRGPRLCAQDGVPGGAYHGGRAESIQRNPGTRRPDRRRILAQVDRGDPRFERDGQVHLRDPIPDGRHRTGGAGSVRDPRGAAGADHARGGPHGIRPAQVLREIALLHPSQGPQFQEDGRGAAAATREGAGGLQHPDARRDRPDDPRGLGHRGEAGAAGADRETVLHAEGTRRRALHGRRAREARRDDRGRRAPADLPLRRRDPSAILSGRRRVQPHPQAAQDARLAPWRGRVPVPVRPRRRHRRPVESDPHPRRAEPEPREYRLLNLLKGNLAHICNQLAGQNMMMSVQQFEAGTVVISGVGDRAFLVFLTTKPVEITKMQGVLANVLKTSIVVRHLFESKPITPEILASYDEAVAGELKRLTRILFVEKFGETKEFKKNKEIAQYLQTKLGALVGPGPLQEIVTMAYNEVGTTAPYMTASHWDRFLTELVDRLREIKGDTVAAK